MAMALLATMPRVFGHAHLAALDTAISLMNFLVITEFFAA